MGAMEHKLNSVRKHGTDYNLGSSACGLQIVGSLLAGSFSRLQAQLF